MALLGKSTCFLTLDFNCHMGLFNHRVIPIAINNVLGIFAQFMSIVLNDMEGFVIAYLEDVIVFSITPEKHIEHLQEVLNRFREHDLKLKLPKC